MNPQYLTSEHIFISDFWGSKRSYIFIWILPSLGACHCPSSVIIVIDLFKDGLLKLLNLFAPIYGYIFIAPHLKVGGGDCPSVPLSVCLSHYWYIVNLHNYLNARKF